MAYSEDYRKAAVEYKQNGHTFKELKEVFGITPCTYYQWVGYLETAGTYKPVIKRTRRWRKIDPAELKKAVEEKPDLCPRELSSKFNCSTTAIRKRLAQLGFTYKKRPSPIRENL
jgi:transposase